MRILRRLWHQFGGIKSQQSGNTLLSWSILKERRVTCLQTRKHVFEFKMEKIINHGLPHIAEQIFDNINTDGLIQLLKVSKTWNSWLKMYF